MEDNKSKVIMVLEEAQVLARKLDDIRVLLGKMVDEETKVAGVADLYSAVDAVKDIIDVPMKQLSALGQFLSYKRLPEMMDDEGVTSVNTSSGYRATVSSRLAVSMLDKENAMGWLRENGHGGVIQETVNAGTLSKLVKEMIETLNVEPPTELFSVKAAPYVSLTKLK